MINEKEILKYIASNEELIKQCNSLYECQNKYMKKENGNTEWTNLFIPEIYIASSLNDMYHSEPCNIKIEYNIKKKQPLLPMNITYQYKNTFYNILKNGRINEINEIEITKLYIEKKRNGDKTLYNFDTSAYYAIYNENIEYRYNYVLNESEENIKKKTCCYYIEYGYWNNMQLKCIDGLKYIASYSDLINDIRNNEELGLKHYFEKGIYEGRYITFKPELYIISNIDKLKDLIELGNIKYKEAISHYIMNGYYQDLKINNFDHFEYLANNPKRIRYLLTTNNEIIWDMNKLIPSIVANDYLKNHPNIKKRKFDKIDFVKRYVGDNKINYDDNLSLKNASYYFVKAYVTHKSLRKTLTSWNKLRKFLQNRIEDMLKQVPLNITKFVVQNKFL